MRAQQLIEQRAVEMSGGRGPGAGDGSEQLDAVADPHLLDWAALGRHDDRNIGQCLLLALQSDPAAATQRGQGAERIRGITRAGHLHGKVVPRRREPQQPVQARPDHIGADQHQQPGAQVRQRLARRMQRELRPEAWIVDETGFPKFGRHSVGVARQYCGALGKVANCQVGVSVNAATDEASYPLDWRLFLPAK